jgi:hypothetical protein
MIRAIETALAGYADRSRDILRLAEKIAKPDGADARSMVGLMANQRAAEAVLAVAHVADETTEALVHIIA